jgi:hypothetical protein
MAGIGDVNHDYPRIPHRTHADEWSLVFIGLFLAFVPNHGYPSCLTTVGRQVAFFISPANSPISTIFSKRIKSRFLQF